RAGAPRRGPGRRARARADGGELPAREAPGRRRRRAARQARLERRQRSGRDARGRLEGKGLQVTRRGTFAAALAVFLAGAARADDSPRELERAYRDARDDDARRTALRALAE